MEWADIFLVYYLIHKQQFCMYLERDVLTALKNQLSRVLR